MEKTSVCSYSQGMGSANNSMQTDGRFASAADAERYAQESI